jgi:hypothetical protein
MLLKEEMSNISDFLGISLDGFLKKYTVVITEGKPYLKNPCPFYKNNSCVIYGVRPISCKMFPFQLDIPLVFGVDFCPLAKEILDEILAISPVADGLDGETYTKKAMKERGKMLESIIPVAYTDIAKGQSACLLFNPSHLHQVRLKLERRK